MKIGVDIGGTRIKAGLINKGKLIKKITINTPKEKVKIIENILFVIELLNSKKVDFIGIGCPGPADYEKGIIGKTPNINLKGVNLKKILKPRLKKKIKFENDASCFALGEARRLKAINLVGLTLGTGVGSGIVLNEWLYKGKGNAGEIGHCTIKFDGKKGLNQGELEAYVSAKAIKKNYGKKPEKLNKKEWNDYGRKLGIGIVNIANSLDPDVISLGGGITHHCNKFWSAMNSEIKKRAVVKVRVIKGDDNSGILGAANLY